MAKTTYRMTWFRRLVNWVVLFLLRVGVRLDTTSLLTVRGRKSGRWQTLPVTLVEQDGKRWVVAPYGAVNWVRNVREAPQVRLTRGRRSETVRLVELEAAEAAKILQQYLKAVPVVRPYFDVTPESPVEDFIAEAPRHPVFRVVETLTDVS